MSVVTLTIATMVSIIVGPVLAVYASDVRTELRVKRDIREKVYQTLVNTRSNIVVPKHADSLREVPFAFPRNKRSWPTGRRKYLKIYEEWKEYTDLLNRSYGGLSESDWCRTVQSPKLLELLTEIGKVIKFPAEPSTLKDPAYVSEYQANSQKYEFQLKQFGVEALGKYINGGGRCQPV